jgi:hypothetical protein
LFDNSSFITLKLKIQTDSSKKNNVTQETNMTATRNQAAETAANSRRDFLAFLSLSLFL